VLGVAINYRQAELFFKKIQVEWIHRPLLDPIFRSQYLDAAKMHGEVELFGEVYTLKDIEELANETEGRISEFKFYNGPCEGFMMHLKMESRQIFNIKTFEKRTLELFLDWVNRLEECDSEETQKRINVPIMSRV